MPGLLSLCMALLLAACTGSGDEDYLVDLHATASQDIISIEFPADSTETTLSVDSVYDFTVQGLKSDGVTLVTITDDLEWSLSDNALSRIDQSGRLTAASDAEFITVTAKLGVLSASIDISISAASFDQVVQLAEQAIVIDMCRSQAFTPIGRYVNDDGSEEIRPVDSTVIDSIEWLITNQEDGSPSQRAYIETSQQRALLQALASGDVLIRARALSLHTGNVVTSVAFDQAIGAAINTVKLCLSSDTDLNGCTVTDASVEKDMTLSLVAVGNYQAADGSDFDENISRNSKWGISNSDASIGFSTDREQLDVTGVTEGGSSVVSVACGTIEQAIDGIDITRGVILGTAVSCVNTGGCVESTVPVAIDKLSVLSFDVTANDNQLEDNVSLQLDTRPGEIVLDVIAFYANDSQATITDDAELVYTIIAIDGQLDVIEEKADNPGVFTVLAAGTAKIQLDYRSMTFLAVIRIP